MAEPQLVDYMQNAPELPAKDKKAIHERRTKKRKLRKKGGVPPVKLAKFVKKYIESGNATEAYRYAYPSAGPTTANSRAYRLLQREQVKEKIKQAMTRAQLDTGELVGVKKDIIAQGTEQLKNQTVKPELLNKTVQELLELQMKISEKNHQESNILNMLNININAPAQEWAGKALKTLEFFDNVLEGSDGVETEPEQTQKSKELRTQLEALTR